MKTISCWSFVCEGLKQAGWIFGALLLLGVFGWIALYIVRGIHNQVFYVDLTPKNWT